MTQEANMDDEKERGFVCNIREVCVPTIIDGGAGVDSFFNITPPCTYNAHCRFSPPSTQNGLHV